MNTDHSEKAVRTRRQSAGIVRQSISICVYLCSSVANFSFRRSTLLLERPAAVRAEPLPPVRPLALDLGVQRLQASRASPDRAGLARLGSVVSRGSAPRSYSSRCLKSRGREELPVAVAEGHVQVLGGRGHVQPPVERPRPRHRGRRPGQHAEDVRPVDHPIGRRSTPHRPRTVGNRSVPITGTSLVVPGGSAPASGRSRGRGFPPHTSTASGRGARRCCRGCVPSGRPPRGRCRR